MIAGGNLYNITLYYSDTAKDCVTINMRVWLLYIYNYFVQFTKFQEAMVFYTISALYLPYVQELFTMTKATGISCKIFTSVCNIHYAKHAIVCHMP